MSPSAEIAQTSRSRSARARSIASRIFAWCGAPWRSFRSADLLEAGLHGDRALLLIGRLHLRAQGARRGEEETCDEHGNPHAPRLLPAGDPAISSVRVRDARLAIPAWIDVTRARSSSRTGATQRVVPFRGLVDAIRFARAAPGRREATHDATSASKNVAERERLECRGNRESRGGVPDAMAGDAGPGFRAHSSAARVWSRSISSFIRSIGRISSSTAAPPAAGMTRRRPGGTATGEDAAPAIVT